MWEEFSLLLPAAATSRIFDIGILRFADVSKILCAEIEKTSDRFDTMDFIYSFFKKEFRKSVRFLGQKFTV